MAKGLLALHSGDAGKIKKIEAGRTATKRLYEMGFTLGTHVKVIKNNGGPVIVSISDNKVALGRGLAEKINLDIPES